MFAIAFDLDTQVTRRVHPKSLTQAYSDIGSLLAGFAFEWRQGSVYTCANEDMANLFEAMAALKASPWFLPRFVTSEPFVSSSGRISREA